VDGHYVTLGGNHTLQAALEKGMTSEPAQVVDLGRLLPGFSDFVGNRAVVVDEFTITK
jgi:hypothetical protein